MPDVVAYLASRPAEAITLETLGKQLQVETVRIQKAISNAISQGIYGDTLRCVHRGRVWVWQPPGYVHQASVVPPSSPSPVPEFPRGMGTAPVSSPKGLSKGDMVEVMGTTATGDAVASDENGRLYRVVPL